MKFLLFLFFIFFYLCLLNGQNLFASTKFELNSDLPTEDFVVAGLTKYNEPEIKKNVIETVASTTTTPANLFTNIIQLTKTTTIQPYLIVKESISSPIPLIALRNSQNLHQSFIPNNLFSQNVQSLQTLVKSSKNNKNDNKNSEKWFVDNINLKDCSNDGNYVSQAFRHKFALNLVKNTKNAKFADLLSARIKECSEKNNNNYWARVNNLLNNIEALIIEKDECRNGLIEEQIACINVLSYSCQFIQSSYAFKLIPTSIVIQEARLAENGAMVSSSPSSNRVLAPSLTSCETTVSGSTVDSDNFLLELKYNNSESESFKDDFKHDSKINVKFEAVNTETSTTSINNVVVLPSSSFVYSNAVVRIDSSSKDCNQMLTTNSGTSNAPPPSSLSTTTSQQQQQQLPVALIIATTAPTLLSSSTSSLLPPLQSCSDTTTILNSSTTTSSITTPIHLKNNIIKGEIVENEKLNILSDSSLSNGNLSSITSLTVAQTLNLFNNANNNNATSITASDDFVKRLIEAVRKQPCLYNPNHEHYGNKHSSAQYRTIVWQNLCKELDYPEDSHSLQTQWKRVRDRYVRERRKRKSSGVVDIVLDSQSSNLSAAARHYNSMRWIDEFLSENNSSTINSNNNYSNICSSASNNLSNSAADAVISNNVGNLSTSGEIYYSQHPNRRRSTKHQLDDLITTNQSYRYESPATNLNRSIGHCAQKNNESTNGSPSSTSSEISVGSVAFGAVQPSQSTQLHLMYRGKVSGSVVAGISPLSQQIPQHINHHTGSMPSSSSTAPSAVVMSTGDAHYQLLSVPAPGLGSGVVNLSHNGQAKEQVMTMVIDPSTGQFYHQHNPATASSSGLIGGNIIATNQQQQRMYRLVNLPPSSSSNGIEIQQQHLINHHHSQQQLIPTSTTESIQQQMLLSQQHQQGTHPPRHKRMAMAQVTSSKQQHLLQTQSQQHEMLIDTHHGQQQSQTIVIEQGQDRILINHQHQLQQPQQTGHLVGGNLSGTADGMIVQHHTLHELSQNTHQIHANSSHLQHGTHSSSRLINNRGNNRNNISGTIITDHLSPRQHILTQGNATQQHYILSTPPATSQQHHYDPDSALIETIVTHLGILNEDEKVVTKMNIQRILMDARFGRGACVRMFREEEQSENMAAAAAALEASQHQQQQNRHLHVQQQQQGSRR